MEAIRHLGRRRRPVSGTVGIGFRAIPRDHRNAGGCLEPLRARVARAVREQGDGLAAFQIKEHGARGRAFAQGAIVHPQPAGRGDVRQRLLAPQAPECVPAHPQVPLVAKLHPGCALAGAAQRDQALGEPAGASSPGGRPRGQAFGTDAATAGAIAAQPLAHAEREAHAILRPGQVGEGALIRTVDTPRWCGAEWTGHTGLRRGHAQRALRRSGIDVTRVEVQRGRIGEQACKDVGCLCGDDSGFLLKATMSMGKRLWMDEV